MSNIYRTNYDVVFNGTTSDDVIYAYAWSDFVYADRGKGYLHTTVTTILGIALMIWGAYGNAAGAVELFTAPLSIQTTNPDAPLRGLRCHFVNVSHSPRGGTIEIIRLDGMALSTTSYSEVAPGGGTGDSVSVLPPFGAPITTAYCKITVNPLPNEKPDITVKAVRASFDLTDQNGNSVATLEAR